MTTFGSYEAVRELYRGRLLKVFEARRAGGDGGGKFAVYVFTPPPESLSPEVLQHETQLFLEAAQVQQKVAQSGAQHWAPTHEYGQADAGAYFVTDFYERSVRRLILAQVRLDAYTLHTIVSGLVQGLIELREACGRAHGDLNPYNGFLIESTRGVIAKAVLANPLPTSRLAPDAGDATDLRALGQLIHQLVLHKPPSALGGWPVPESPQWSSLGKKADDWLALCNQLLDPDLIKHCPTLQQIAHEQLPDLAASRRPPWPRVAVAAGLVAVVAVGGGVWLWSMQNGQPIDGSGQIQFGPDQTQWAKICHAYDDWVEPLYFVGYVKHRLDAWDDDPHLRAVVEQLRQSDQLDQIDPGKIAAIKGPRSAYASAPPQKTHTREAAHRVQTAYEIVAAMEAALTSWPPLLRIKDRAQQFEQMQLSAPAQYLGALAESTQLKWPGRGEKREDFITAYNSILRHGQAMEDLFGIGQTDTQIVQPLHGVFLETAVGYLQRDDQPQADDESRGFATKLSQLLQLRDQLAMAADSIRKSQNGIDRIRDQFRDDPALRDYQRDLDRYTNNIRSTLNLIQKDVAVEQVGPPLEGVQKRLDDLARHVDEFLQTPPLSPDPRTTFGAIPDVGPLRDHIVQLRQYDDHETADTLQAKLAQHASRVRDLLDLAWIRLNQKAIETGFAQVQAGLSALNDRARQRITYLGHRLTQPDPREALVHDTRRVRQDLVRLAGFDETASRRLSQELNAIQERLDVLAPRPWIRAFADEIIADSQALGQDLHNLNQRVFAGLDPRHDGGWRDLVQMIDQEMERSPVAPEVKQQFASVRRQLEDARVLVWSLDSRDKIEKQYHALQEQLNRVAEQVISDQRNLFEKKWEQAAAQIDATLGFRRELADPQNTDLAAQFLEIQSQKQELFGQPWPDDAQGRSAIRTAVRQVEQRLDAFYMQIDPRPLWEMSARQWRSQIQEGVQQLQAKADPQADEYLRQLQRLADARTPLTWNLRSQQQMIGHIRQQWRALEQLHRAVYAKLDPRLQVAWEQVAHEIEAEISWLDRNDKMAARQLSADLSAILDQVAQLKARPWNQDDKEAIEDQVADLHSRLRSIYVAAVSAPTQVEGVSAQALNDAWRKRRDEIISGPGDVGKLQDQIRLLRQLLRERSDGLSTALPGRSHPRAWRVDLASQVFAAKRQRLLDDAFKPWLDGSAPWSSVADQTQWGRVVQAYEKWRDSVVALMEDFKAIETAFDNAYGLDDAPRGYKESVRQLYNQWSRQELFGSFNYTIGSLSQVVSMLEAIDRSDNTPDLLEMANRGRTDLNPAVTFAAWRKLGQPGLRSTWPASIDDLRQENQLRQWLTTMVRDSIEDVSQKQRLFTELRGQGHDRWSRCLTRLSKIQDIEEAFRLMAGFDVQIDQLPPVARFDIRLYEFKEHLAGLAHTVAQEQIRSEAERLKRDLTLLPGGTGSRQDVAAFLGQMDELLAKGTQDTDQALDLTKAGPEASSVWNDLAWKKQESDDKTRITYSWTTKKGDEHTLEFVRIDAGPRVSKSFYLCTTEVAFGLVNDLFRATDHWDALLDLLGDPVWQGPKVWEWRRNKLRANEHRRAPIWMPTDTRLRRGGGDIEDYAQGISPAGPDDAYPMQYVSPEAAVYIARLLGCRLPTAAEWRAAFEVEANGMDPAQFVQTHRPNLRDQTWLRQSEYADALDRRGVRINIPSAGSFWQENRGQDVHPYDDAVLWFDRVEPSGISPGRTFHHLVGNVAEWVFDRSEEVEGLDVAQPDVAQLSNAIRSLAQPRAVAVMGGSAQSPPTVSFQEAQPLVADGAAGPRSYSDVGFRLAFSASRQSLKARLQEFVDSRGYLATGTLGAQPQSGD